MIRTIIWSLLGILYLPIFKILYKPVWAGLLHGPVQFFKAFGEPWGDLADYTHAYFVLPIVISLIWSKRNQLAIEPNNNLLGGIVFVLGLMLYTVGWSQNYLFISTLSLLPSIYGAFILLYGMGSTKVLTFPILYLLFLVPPPVAVIDTITLPMRHGISAAAEVVLRFFDYPVTRDGLLLTIGYNEIFMGQPCSGFRSLITMFALVLVYVYIKSDNKSETFFLILIIVPFALMGNLLRVITLCLITYYFGEEAGQGFFHNFSGIMVFIITILGIIGVESLLDRHRKLIAN